MHACRSTLEDPTSPNTQALLNAIGAARRGHVHLLVARAVERALARPGADAELLRLAREALVEASPHLARVELSCKPARADSEAAACALSIDGANVEPGRHHLLPGTHRLAGQLAGGERDEQPLTFSAGATYTVVVSPARAGTAPTAPGASASASSAPSSAVTSAPSTSKGWPRAVVYVGTGLTAVLAGVSIWSGVDAIDAKKALPPQPFRAQNDDVLARAHRTDGLVAAAGALAVATVVAAVWLVGWDTAPKASSRSHGGSVAFGVAPSFGGATAVLGGQF